MQLLKAIIQLILLACIILFGVAYFNKDKLPDQDEIVDLVYQEPIQKEVNIEPFESNLSWLVNHNFTNPAKCNKN